MRRIIVILALAGCVFLGIAIAARGGASAPAAGSVSPRELVAAGWGCVNPGYWVHCSPPGIDIGTAPPVIVSLNFYTTDPNAAKARFLGFEDLIRADIWKKLRRHWPCGTKASYRRVPGDSLPKPGYMYCHRFDDTLAPPK